MAEPETPEPGAQAAPASTRDPRRARGVWRRAIKGLAVAVGTLVLLLVVAVGALWFWSGSNGSLAQALQLAQRYVPLRVSGVTGSIRGGGSIEHLTYLQDGLSVEVDGAQLKWQPSALLNRRLEIERLVADSIEVEDRRPAAPAQPATGPPQSLELPIRIDVDRFEVGRVEWAGATPLEVTRIAGSYAYDGQQHRLTLDSIELMNGHYSGSATVTDSAPIMVDAKGSGKLKTDVPGGAEGLGLTVDVTANGALTDLAIEANARADVAPAAAPGREPPHASVTVHLTPFAKQPLLTADATFSDFDAGALWPVAPHTQLTGQLHLTPAAPAAAGGTPGWHLKADIVNALPGPWDQQRIPLERVEAEGDWRNGTALIERLEAKIGGGTLHAHGTWAAAPSPAAGWYLEATLDHVSPAGLHSQLAGLPIDGKASARGQSGAIDFDVALHADATNGASPAAVQLADELRQLELQDVRAAGRWADGQLSLSALRVRTDDAELSGALELWPAGPGGQGRLRFSAPGLDVQAEGTLREHSGAGQATLTASDVARVLEWVKPLPGVPASVGQARASGRATLSAHWSGGWRDPTLKLQLDVPKLDYMPPPSADATAASKASGTPATSDTASQAPGTVAMKDAAVQAPGASTIHVRGLNASLVGKLDQATIEVDGRAGIGERQIDLNLAANVGRMNGDRAWAESAWHGTVETLVASLLDPARGKGAWKLAFQGDVPFTWSPTPGTGSFVAGAGKAVLSAPAAQGSTAMPAVIEWQPVRWRDGELKTQGRLVGLPLAWAERVSGGRLAGGRISGDMVFNGDWDVTLGERLDVQAKLYRASGDLNIVTGPGPGGAHTIAAGVKEARLSVKSDGNDLKLDLRWRSDHAGDIEGAISTRLSRAGPKGGWTLAPDAPLEGTLQVQLPRIGVWSQLAPPGWRLEGAIRTDLRVAGTLADPQLAGSIQADDLALRSIVDGFAFSDGRLRARLDGQKLTIDEFTLYGAGGKGKGGSIGASGSVELAGGKPLVKLDVKLDHLQPSIRTDAQIALSGALQARLEDRLATVTGALHVDRARIELPEDSAPKLGDDVVVRRGDTRAAGAEAASTTATATADTVAPGARGEAAPAAHVDPPLAVKLDVTIDLGKDFQVSGHGLTTRLEGTLTVAGDSLIDPRVTGDIRTVDGKFRAYGQRLDVAHGLIRFTGKPTNPSLDILALRACERCEVKAGVAVTGTALAPRVRLYSDPNVPDSDKLSWLVLGRATPADGAEAALLQAAALAFVSGKDSGGGFAGKLGLDELSIGEAKGGSSAGSTAVTIGKRFSKNFYAAYERSLSGAVGTLFLFYDLTDRLTLRGETGERSALDLIYTLKYD